MNIISAIWSELKTPDSYSKDWYGYLTNQVSHLALGFATACVMSNLHFMVFGEFAEKWALWFAIAVCYATFELTGQGWRGKDTIEDWIFVSVYGAGVPIAVFSEIEKGNPDLVLNSRVVVPIICFIVAHLIGGIVARVYLKLRGR